MRRIIKKREAKNFEKYFILNARTSEIIAGIKIYPIFIEKLFRLRFGAKKPLIISAKEISTNILFRCKNFKTLSPTPKSVKIKMHPKIKMLISILTPTLKLRKNQNLLKKFFIKA